MLIRKPIVLPAGVSSVTVSVAVDNDVEVYWNGVAFGSATHDFCPAYNDFVFTVPSILVFAGTNVLSVEGIDRGGQSFLDVTVTANVGGPPPAGPPTVAGVAPNDGSIVGGESVTVTGTNFTSSSTAAFGGVMAQSTTFQSSTQLVAVTPATTGPGIVDVTVTNDLGTSAPNASDLFTYDTGTYGASAGTQTLWLESCDDSGCVPWSFPVISQLGVQWKISGMNTPSPFFTITDDLVSTDVQGGRGYNIAGAEAKATLPGVRHYEGSTLSDSLGLTPTPANGNPDDAFTGGSTTPNVDPGHYINPGVCTSLLATGTADWYGVVTFSYGVSWSLGPLGSLTC
jgi:hypothetical protein